MLWNILKKVMPVFCTLLVFVISEIAFAHSGRTNSSGCHNNRKTGGYHCHNSGTSYSKPRTPNYNTNSSNSYNSRSKIKDLSSTTAELDKKLVLRIQQHLNKLGYNAGTEDGILGKQTSNAIKQFQTMNGLDIDGVASQELMNQLISSVKQTRSST